MNRVAALLDEAFRHHQGGRLDDAERLYREILAEDGRHADTLHLLGVLAHQIGKDEPAVALIGQAIEINDAESAYHSNLGIALRALNRLDEALASYDAALRLQPDYAEAHSNRGNILGELGRPGEALASYDTALCIKPNYTDAYTNRGNALKKLDRFGEALTSYGNALRIKPDLAETHSNRGAVLIEVGRLDEARAAVEAALGVKPDHAEAHSNRGNILKDLSRPKEALASYDAALRIKPDMAEALSNRGIVLRDFGRLSEALLSFDSALRLKPDLPEAHSNRGTVLRDLGQFDESLESHRAALRVKPDLVQAHSNLIFDLHYGSDIPDETIQAATRRFASLYGPVRPSFANSPDPGRRLRIGYVSGDLGRHSAAYFLAPVLANHDHLAFEIVCYATHGRNDDMTARLRSSANHWRSLAGLSDQAAAELVTHDRIDILVDLSGHTAFNRLPVFARKPAPVQVTWLGFPGTTGLAAIDYRLVDDISDPESGLNNWASETLFRLPDGFLCFDPRTESPDVAPPPGLDGAITFGSFNNPAKLSLATLDVWAALMARVPKARLLLKGKPFGDEMARALLLERLRSRGVASDRVSLYSWASDPGGHLGLYGQVDIALDPFPYNGTTTTCEALWMGVPVVTLEGTRHSGRVGASLLTRLGLGELITADTDTYVRIAADLAADRDRMSELRRSLRSRMSASPLCDGPGFTRTLEAAFRSMWRNWCGKAAA